VSDLEDFEIRQSRQAQSEEDELPPPLPPSRIGAGRIAWGAAGLLVIGAAAITWVVWRSRTPSARVVAPTPTATLPAPTATASAIALPALDQSDPLVRDLLRAASRHLLLETWLTGKALIRTAVVVVDNIANDENPAPHLRFLAPTEGFQVLQKRGRVSIDPKSYSRYDAVAEAAASLDMKTVAGAIQALDPLLDVAYRELGHPEGGFRRTLQGVLSTLAKTSVPEGEVVVIPVLRSVLVYEYADFRLESLRPAEKQLVRMGARNAQVVQGKLRELIETLGPSPEKNQ
jgi:hypothetical protein